MQKTRWRAPLCGARGAVVLGLALSAACDGNGQWSGAPDAQEEGGESGEEGGESGGSDVAGPSPGEVVRSLCETVSCEPNGSCVVADGEPRCLCAVGYHESPQGCEPNDPGSPCADVECSGNGSCVVLDEALGWVGCACDEGFVAVGTMCLAASGPGGGCELDEMAPGIDVCVVKDNPAEGGVVALPDPPPGAGGFDDIPEMVDHRSEYLDELCPTISDQWGCGWCTLHATTQMLEARQCAAGLPAVLVSEPHVRYAAGDDVKNCADGSAISSALAGAHSTALLPLAAWPYEGTKLGRQKATIPEPSVLAAGSVLSGKPYSVPGKDVFALKNALAAGADVVYAVPVYANPETHHKPGWHTDGHIGVPAQELELAGWHAIVIVGYDDAEAVFHFRNSWGAAWPIDGGGGYGTLAYAFVDAYGGGGGYISTVSVGCAPTAEVCDGQDNDCDDDVDEGLVRSCVPADPLCKGGETACVKGAWSACEPVGCAEPVAPVSTGIVPWMSALLL